ncbi:MAG: hypothetical protein AAGL23_18525 [Pseudomonadota bacterium]
MPLRDAPARHARLFELLRQENLARNARDAFEPPEHDLKWESAFTVKALASLRAA